MINQDFFAAIKIGDVSSVTQFLEDEPRLLEGRDETGATPLHYAALNGHRELVRLLVAKGADVNRLDAKFGATPAGWAIEYLRELGGFLAIEIEDLLYAIQKRDAEWVARLDDRFPRLKDQSDSNGVPLTEHAKNCGDEKIAKIIVRDNGGQP